MPRTALAPDLSPGEATAPRVQGWCPGALRPMMSGDGLVMRLRPRLARFTREQILGICDAAMRHAAGLIDLTSRANLQVRGVAQADWPALIDIFGGLGLLDEDTGLESRRNLLVAPDWVAGDDTERIATELLARLDELPDLPAKVGFAIDAGAAPRLLDDSADFRIERGAHGGLILRADGRVAGVPLAAGAEVDALIALVRWFADGGGKVSGRMARHPAPLPAWAMGDVAPGPSAGALRSGVHALGVVCALPFGQVRAEDLAQAVRSSGALALRATPWRRVLLEGAAPDAAPRLAPGWPDMDVADLAGWRVEACAGAPFCSQASVETRPLAYRLLELAQQGRLGAQRGAAPAGADTRTVHVSGCAKGCAHPAAAAVCLTGRAGAFDLAFDARPGEPPQTADLGMDAVLARLGVN
ncbi:precorrin-3B synthase [Thauera linaloolentis]|uniref:Precorrin-3B synthase n=1 Tax=Thauera linaloolentis (strain DSM 12138 / JCM 21573 / CCUG 41526 / CIP 105981 / IAM 15112 / NBRC 102519 / 47Lol) TaxID=1123367 RepID=N6Y2S4_THAL4|nr:precorrin-3B synthase [Thauera linaloolentis]ENO85840.1 precorrin-3B synthase [Thauera linaloolentis 47Lol = DSM 12138]MCM8567413.1 cobalamin biosynthesis protein CobG [Thauera linaloolentis]